MLEIRHHSTLGPKRKKRKRKRVVLKTWYRNVNCPKEIENNVERRHHI